MTVFTDVEAAMEEAQYLADSTRVPHLLVQGLDGYMRVISQGEAFTGSMLEKFSPNP